MLILVAFCSQRAPKGSQMGPKWCPKRPKWISRAPKWSQMATMGRPRSPKRRVQGGVREKVEKKDAPPRETAKQMDAKLHNFWSYVVHFGVIFSMFFQGCFLIDLLMVLGLMFDGFWNVVSMIFGPFSRSPEPLFFDNSPVRKLGFTISNCVIFLTCWVLFLLRFLC